MEKVAIEKLGALPGQRLSWVGVQVVRTVETRVLLLRRQE